LVYRGLGKGYPFPNPLYTKPLSEGKALDKLVRGGGYVNI